MQSPTQADVLARLQRGSPRGLGIFIFVDLLCSRFGSTKSFIGQPSVVVVCQQNRDTEVSVTD